MSAGEKNKNEGNVLTRRSKQVTDTKKTIRSDISTILTQQKDLIQEKYAKVLTRVSSSEKKSSKYRRKSYLSYIYRSPILLLCKY